MITAKKRKYGDSCKASSIAFLKIKTRMIQDATFIPSDPWHAKADKPRKMKQKQGEAEIEYGQKRW